jgi:SAM-dependent methyltransferase
MISKLPAEFWSQKHLRILDPCCGNGNFSVPLYFELLKHHDKQTILEQILEHNDINPQRLDNLRTMFRNDLYPLSITQHDFISHVYPKETKYDLIVANPPYAKFLDNGKRASKNHNLISLFLEKSLSLLKPDGYLLFITPDNWMSYADRNQMIGVLTLLQICHLDIHGAKKYFKKIGSSFTWYLVQNCPFYKDMSVSGIWKKQEYHGFVKSQTRRYIPLLYNQVVQNILAKTIDHAGLEKMQIQTSSNLHRYTKAAWIRNEPCDVYKYRLIHTPSQTVWASRPHKFQHGFKVFISTTDKYRVFVDTDVGMTQSIAFILCSSEEDAQKKAHLLQHPLYQFLNNICRWGNFNNIRILQHFPFVDDEDVYKALGLVDEEIHFIESH